MAHAEKCPICGGSGKIAAGPISTDAEPVSCHGCMGRGWVTVNDPREPFIHEYEPPVVKCGGYISHPVDICDVDSETICSHDGTEDITIDMSQNHDDALSSTKCDEPKYSLITWSAVLTVGDEVT